jgi:chromate transporter
MVIIKIHGLFYQTHAKHLGVKVVIFLGAPHIEQLRGNARVTAALSAITAAVVGVILNLAIWFGLHVLFPTGAPVNTFGVVVCGVAFVGIARWNWGVIPVVLGAAAAGVVRTL